MRKTKIVATVGPATRAPAQLARLIEAGCNVIRINMSHASQEEAASLIQDVRTLSSQVGLLLDTKGPEVRTTEVAAPIELVEGQEVYVRGEAGLTEPGLIRVTYNALPRVLDPGISVLLADGQIELVVMDVEPGQLQCLVKRGGTLGSKKGVNIPGIKLPMPFLSERDMSDIAFACEQGVDFIACSFVSDGEDLMKVRRLCDRYDAQPLLIAKIENRNAVQNLGEIVQASDGIMVARGDLGVEIPLEEVPVVQKQIIASCLEAGKAVIVATEMLDSMMHNPRPTRAEVSDVANAIFEGADAVMLSGETGAGQYPIESVQMMSRIAQMTEAEVARQMRGLPGGARVEDVTELICKSAWLAAQEMNIRAIVVPTSSGETARRISRYRPRAPILATTPNLEVARRLSLSYGVVALPIRHYGRLENMVRRSVQLMVDSDYLRLEDRVAVIAGVPVGRSGTTNLLTLQQVSNLVGPRESRERMAFNLGQAPE